MSRRPLSLLARYDALARTGAIERDSAQLAALKALDRLAEELTPRAPAASLFSFFTRAAPPPAPRGVYLWGHVGRGKTTLMDLFFEAAMVAKKRRVHFHAFMTEIHARLHAARRDAKGAAADPVQSVAEALAREARLLCFDEFSVFDIADATILARLFKTLLAQGVVVVATSNVEPGRLYEGGRNRELFLPFIALLLERMEVVELDARADFRLTKKCVCDVFFLVRDAASRNAAEAQLSAFMGAGPYDPLTLPVNGRTLDVPQTCGQIARFRFAEICGRPLGPADYLALARRFEAIVIEDVPAMGIERRNEAKRFITLIDILYEAKTKLILSAEAAVEDLYRADRGAEALEFPRTTSRLIEMRSQEYLDNCPFVLNRSMSAP
jgi:cell division protein ZapE